MARLQKYIDRVAGPVRDRRSRASFALYAQGLLSDGERKSMEPMAARMCAHSDDVAEVQQAHDRLLHLVSKSEWDDDPVRLEAAHYALEAVRARGESVEVSIIDDTGFLKQGKHSPGVQRQYTGSAGKIANCQLGVSLTVASRSTHVPIDMDLYLPKVWTEDRARCRAAKIPDHVEHREKWVMALSMIERAKRNAIPLGVVLADSAFGDVAAFRGALLCMKLPYAVAVHSTSKVIELDTRGGERGKAAVGNIGKKLQSKAFRNVTWRQGSARALCARFARCRVRVDGAEQDLIIEWPKDEPAPTKFYLVAMPGKPTTKQMVRIIKQRWRTERFYEDAKGELGLDHYEGRSWRGWQHHVTLVLVCYAFVVAEQLRFFSLTTRGARWDDEIAPAA